MTTAEYDALRNHDDVTLARERMEQADRAENICGAVLRKLDDLTAALPLDQYRDVLDELAGRIEARLEALDEQESLERSTPEDEE